MSFNPTKLYGSTGAEGVWVTHETGARFCLLKPNSRRMMMVMLENSTLGELEEIDDEARILEEMKEKSQEEQEAFIAARSKELAMKEAGELVAKQARLSTSRIISWENVTDGNDDIEVPFSKEKAYEFCYNYPEFRSWVEKSAFELVEKDKETTAKKKAQIKKK